MSYGFIGFQYSGTFVGKGVRKTMDKHNIVSFAPQGEKKKHRIPHIVVISVIGCLFAFLVSVFTILAINDFDISKALGARQEGIAEEETTAAAGENEGLSEMTDFSEAFTFLALCSDKDELTFCQLISVDIANGKIRVKPLPLDYRLVLAGGETDISEVFRNDSLSVLAAAFSSRNINIKKYVHVTEDNFRMLMSKLGAVAVEITGSYEFNIDAVRYTFTPGVQNMTSDTLLKYMKFSESGEAGLRLQGNVIAEIFRQHFTKENFGKGESFFSTLINLVDTNITVFDYTAAQPVLSALLAGTVEVAVVS